MGERIAVYPGSFDPPTNGHIHTLERGFSLFDVVHVLIAYNPDKHTLLSGEDREEVFKWFGDLWADTAGNIRVLKTAILPSHRTTVEYAADVDATHLIRGLRSETDFSYEQRMQHANSKLCEQFGIPELETVYMGAPLNEDLYISSSLIRGFMGLENWELARSVASTKWSWCAGSRSRCSSRPRRRRRPA